MQGPPYRSPVRILKGSLKGCRPRWSMFRGTGRYIRVQPQANSGPQTNPGFTPWVPQTSLQTNIWLGLGGTVALWRLAASTEFCPLPKPATFVNVRSHFGSSLLLLRHPSQRERRLPPPHGRDSAPPWTRSPWGTWMLSSKSARRRKLNSSSSEKFITDVFGAGVWISWKQLQR